MRDIKFRAWDKQSHIWLDDDEYVIKPDSGAVAEIDYADGYVVIAADNHDVVLEQYTGLKDKNGVEIYENDVVMWRDGESVRCAQVVFTPDIKFLTHDYVFSYGRFAYKDTENHLTVIGNVHENADLLNDTDRISPDDIGNDIH